MNRSVLISIVLVVALVGWIASGMLFETEDAAPPEPPRAAGDVLVEARRLSAQPVTRSLLIQGEVRPVREVVLRSEADGTVAEIPVEEGGRIEEGALVVRLALEELVARREEVRAQVAQREADYEAATRLGERGYTPEQRVREAFTQLQAARAALARIEQEIENTTIEAPFSGIVNEVAVEVGEFVSANGTVATLIDNDPLVVTVNVPQQSIDQVSVGAPANVTFVTGREAQGRITYVSANAQRETRTFRVDVEVPNPDGRTPSGISAEARIPIETVPAHFLSPALLSLGTDGALGVKTVDADNVVRFYPVEIVRAQADGIWVSGLPSQIRLVTTGQGFVRAGERVTVAESSNAQPAPPALPQTVPTAREPAPAAGSTAPAPPESADRSQAAQTAPPAVVAAAPSPEEPTPTLPVPVSIAEIQLALAAAGFDPGPADGVPGPQTVDAIRSAQARFGLPVTGEPDPELLQRLRARATAGSGQ
ncbi:efflux RND transporter periplasmic adaptor subunit [Microvirga roseola]|uniref:efflux RND transporter periplasmic adaptor subunit n=1 Tax=Microvirga roseola TaxID=2883126 RepID=UPI001E455131|nr:efflux RND transporter periplasmic adaptor subunit [Microvirga roseola]